MGMDPATAMIGSAVIGGASGAYGANQAKKAQDEANRLNREQFEMYKPYITDSLAAGQGYLDDVQNTGAYMGQTLAGPNMYEKVGNNFIGNMGAMGAQGAFDLSQVGQNFGQNYADLYAAGSDDRLAQARDYALSNSGPLIEAAMRDDYRTLTEQTLPGINMASSGGGNINSSRAGIADAVAARGYNDRRADTAATINQNLMNQSVNQQNRQFTDMMNANRGLDQSYQRGINAMGTMGDFMTGAGANLRGFDQDYLNDLRDRFERDRDFGLDTQMRYQAGMLGNAPGAPQVQPNMNSTAAGGFGGAMQGLGYGMDFMNSYANYKDKFGGGMPPTNSVQSAMNTVYGGGP